MDSDFDELYQKYHQDVFQFLFYMVIILRFFHDLSITETIEALSWTESKVKSLGIAH